MIGDRSFESIHVERSARRSDEAKHAASMRVTFLVHTC